MATFTDFTVRSGGSNLYSGSTSGSGEESTTPLVSYAAGTFINSTRTFTPAAPAHAATFAGSSNSNFLAVTNAVFLPSASISFAMWLYLDNSSYGGTIAPLSVSSGATARNYALRLTSGRAPSFEMYSAAGTAVATATSGTTGTQNGWIFVVCTYDPSVSTFGQAAISVNGGAFTTNNLSVAVNTLSNPFTLGVEQGVASSQFDGAIDAVGVWQSRVLTAGEASTLYAAGLGQSYADLTAGQKTSMVAWWQLNESSGSRSDSHSGAHTLTATGTVGQGQGLANDEGGTRPNPSTDGMAAGNFVSIYITSGATVATYVARVTSVTSTNFVTSSTAFAGTLPSDGLGNMTAVVGGAWLGPNAAVGFPFNFIATALTNASGNIPRVNFKNNATYSITAAITHSISGPVVFQGYTTTFADGGKWNLDAGTSTIVPLTISGQTAIMADFIVSNNGTTGTNAGLVISGARNAAFRCVAHDIRGFGISFTNTLGYAEECEAYLCNTANTSDSGGMQITELAVRCISHDNAGSNNNGFVMNLGAGSTLIGCIADTNGAAGFRCSLNQRYNFYNCDAYNNGSHGLNFAISSGTQHGWVVNSNFIKNGGFGISISSSNLIGYFLNNGFGAGTQANSSGTTNIPAASPVQEIGSITYASGVTPWNAPATGDFSITLAAAKAAGRGALTQTQASYTGTVAYPDIGAAQASDASGSSPPNLGVRTGGRL